MATYAENDFKLSMKPFKGCTSTNDGKSGKVPQPLKTNGDSTKYLKGDGTWADADATKLGGQLPAYYAKKSELNTTNANIGNKTNLTTTEKSTIVGAINENKENIDTETTNRTTADTALGVRIDTETTNRTTADTALGVRIDTETTNRTTADTALGVRIDTETTNRTTADTALGVRIDTETTNRTTADTNLQGQIDDMLDGTTAVKTAEQVQGIDSTQMSNLFNGNWTWLRSFTSTGSPVLKPVKRGTYVVKVVGATGALVNGTITANASFLMDVEDDYCSSIFAINDPDGWHWARIKAFRYDNEQCLLYTCIYDSDASIWLQYDNCDICVSQFGFYSAMGWW